MLARDERWPELENFSRFDDSLEGQMALTQLGLLYRGNRGEEGRERKRAREN
jgi:hypothetical protein